MGVSWPAGVLAWIGMALYWAADITAVGVCLVAFDHHHVRLAAVILGYATGYALTRRTLPLAGAGPVEALLPFALAWVSYPLACAVVAVAAYRLFNLWFTIPMSSAGLVRLRRAGRRASVEERPVPQLATAP